MKQFKLYLAGPDVFRADAKEHGDNLKVICAAYGFAGLFPLDGQIDLTESLTKVQDAQQIYLADVKLMDQCDAIVANMNPFRGPSMDVGTAFEIGYCVAQGKPVFGYCEDPRNYLQKVIDQDGKAPFYDSKKIPRDSDEMQIEDDGLIDNLMMTIPALKCAPIARTFEEAVIAAGCHFYREKKKS